LEGDPKGVVAIETEDIAIVFDNDTHGYGIAYYLRDGSEWNLIGNTPQPFSYTLAINEDHFDVKYEIQEIALGDNYAVGKASNSFEGISLNSEVNISVADNYTVRIDLKTSLGGRADGGINQGFSIGANETWEDANYVLPGLWYKHNAYTEDGPGEQASHEWFVREDRLTYPSVTMFCKDYSMTLLRIDPAKEDPEVGGSYLKGLTGNIIYDEQGGYTELGSVGFEDMGNAQEIGIHYPFYEREYSYQKKVPLVNLKFLRSSVLALYDIKDGQKLEHSWWLRIGKEKDFQTAIHNGWKLAYSRCSPELAIQKVDVKNLKESLKNYYDKAYFDAGAISGFLSMWDTYRKLPGLPIFEAGFTGRCLLNAKQYLDYGRENDDDRATERALGIINSWCNETREGFFNELWLVSNWFAEVVPLHLGIPISQYPPFIILTQVSTRRQSEALWALELAYEAEKERGMDHPLWKETIIKNLDKLCEIQSNDGSFARTYHLDGRESDSNPGATSAVVMALTKGYELFGKARYLECAKKSGDYIIENVIAPIDYHGSTLDSNCEDKESATYALYSMRCLYEVDPDEKWLKSAELAAEIVLTWFYLWDVPFDGSSDLGKIGLRTTGFGSVSSENNHIDVYLFDTPSTLLWLGEKIGREEFREMARLIYFNSLQVVPVEGDLKNCARVGFVPEIIQQTLWDYGFYGKGYYSELSCVGWTVASLWCATDMISTDMVKYTN
jgi:hypothetical protein